MSKTGPSLVREGFKKAAICLEKDPQKEYAPGSAEEVAASSLTFLETDIMRAFGSLLEYVARKPCSRSLQYIQLEFVKYG